MKKLLYILLFCPLLAFGQSAVSINYSSPSYGLAASSVSGSVSVDLSTIAGNGAILTVTGNITAFNCTNGVVGKAYLIYLVQDATGSRTIAGFDSKFHFQGSTTPYLNSTAASRTLYQLIVYSSTVYDLLPIYDLP